MDFDLEPAALVAELDAMRASRGLSYQAVADACGVSKATIYRTLTGATEPTMQLLRSIAAAVQWTPKREPPALSDYSKDDYISYLTALRAQDEAEHELRVQQLHAHYNRLRAEDRRTIRWLSISLALVLVFLIGWLIIDVTHPTVGWVQRDFSLRAAVASTARWGESAIL